ncbi:MAG: transglycosylase SLT domain-containing protein [Bacteroidales bacterium]|nr:transglycosylase SLT domain-containing protein [Bacteroidales bacterium]
MKAILKETIMLSASLLAVAFPAWSADPVPLKPTAFAVVENPEVPLSMEFAGNKVALDRIDMFERLDRELTAFTYTHGNTLLMIKRANRYFPEMAPILKKNGIPMDMLYLACIESTLNPRAYSGAKAAGLWQFMADTAKQYGLEVNDYVDERYNTEKATDAACRYMKAAYQKYGNWESVAASYNGGMGRISTELQKQLASSAYDLYLTDETSRYMFRLLACKLIMDNPKAYGYQLDRHQLYQPIECDVVTVDGPVDDWAAWAKDKGISYMQLRDANPWIRAKSLPNKDGKTYSVKIPKADSLSRARQKRTVYNTNWVTK